MCVVLKKLAAILLGMICFGLLPVFAQDAITSASAGLRVMVVKSRGGAPVHEIYGSLEEVPSRSAHAIIPGEVPIRASTSDGSDWYAINSSGGSGSCFVRAASHWDLRDGRGGSRICNSAVDGNTYRGLAYDGQLFYTLRWSADRHYWQSYLNWDDVINNRPYATQTSKTVGDIYRGITFDPFKRVFVSLAQTGSSVYILRYATFNDMVTITPLPNPIKFETGDQYAGIAMGPANNTLGIILVAGQSNALGELADGAKLPRHWADPNVPFYYQNYSYFDPVSQNSVRPGTSGSVQTLSTQYMQGAAWLHFGPEILMARTLAESDSIRRFAMVKVSVGGTNLYEQWNPQNAHKSNLMFKMLQDSYSKASTMWNAQSWRTRLIGIAWIQGEADSGNSVTSSAYLSNLTEFMKQIRTMAGNTCLPVVIASVANRPANIGWDVATVRSAQQKFVANDKCAALVETSDLPVSSDNVHYTTDGQIELGRRMGRAYLSIIRR